MTSEDNTPSPDDPSHRKFRHDEPEEEPQKGYHTILEQQTSSAEEELKRPALGLLLSGLAAGLDIGFGPFAMAVSSTLLRDTVSPPMLEFIRAHLYSIGFVFIVLGRSELFTEHTTSAMLPVLARRASLASMMRLWGVILVANLAGGVLFAFFSTKIGVALGAADAKAFGELAHAMVSQNADVIFYSAIGAGWLMGLLTWLVTSARDTIAQIVVVWLTTFVIGVAGMHHSIAGAIEVLMGVMVGEGASPADYWRFLALAVPGNALGGSLFVAALKYSHVRASTD